MKQFIGRNFAFVGAFALLGALMSSTQLQAADPVKLSLLTTNNANALPIFEQWVKDFEAANPDISIDIETRPGGSEGDNIIRTRLATGEMPDIFNYNSGSQLMGTNPEKYLLDLSGEPWMGTILDGFKKVVSLNGHIYGAPFDTARGGGVLYNIPIYKELGLSIPKTWAEFMANNEKIKAAGKVPVIQTFGTTWTSQLFLLGDYYNVQVQEPDFAERYTANKVKFADDPNILKGFQHQVDVLNAGYLNEDYAAATYEDGQRMIAEGEGAHYPMLTFAIAAITSNYPDEIKNVGFFALPGDDASKNGLTTWYPDGIFIPKTSKHPEEAKRFLAFVVSKEGCESQMKAVGVVGPFMIKGCDLPKDIPQAVAELTSYFKDDATNAPALEFLSPLKGPALEQITVEVGSGIRPPAEGAGLYDQDIRKQAQQLGLPGWQE